jgi:hypothetical protein
VQHLVMCSSIPPLKTWKGKGVEGEATPSWWVEYYFYFTRESPAHPQLP